MEGSRNNIGHILITGAEARQILQAASWLDDLDMSSMYQHPLKSGIDAFAVIEGRGGSLHLLQIASFSVAADRTGLLDFEQSLLQCVDGSSSFRVPCSNLLDLLPPGVSSSLGVAMSSSQWERALQQLEERIAAGARAPTDPRVSICTSTVQVGWTMLRLQCLHRCYNLLLPLQQLLASHDHTMKQLAALRTGSNTCNWPQQTAANSKAVSDSISGVAASQHVVSQQVAVQQAIRDWLPNVPEDKRGVLLQLVTTTTSKLQQLSVERLMRRLREVHKQRPLQQQPTVGQTQLHTTGSLKHTQQQGQASLQAQPQKPRAMPIDLQTPAVKRAAADSQPDGMRLDSPLAKKARTDEPAAGKTAAAAVATGAPQPPSAQAAAAPAAACIATPATAAVAAAASVKAAPAAAVSKQQAVGYRQTAATRKQQQQQQGPAGSKRAAAAAAAADQSPAKKQKAASGVSSPQQVLAAPQKQQPHKALEAAKQPTKAAAAAAGQKQQEQAKVEASGVHNSSPISKPTHEQQPVREQQQQVNATQLKQERSGSLLSPAAKAAHAAVEQAGCRPAGLSPAASGGLKPSAAAAAESVMAYDGDQDGGTYGSAAAAAAAAAAGGLKPAGGHEASTVGGTAEPLPYQGGTRDSPAAAPNQAVAGSTAARINTAKLARGFTTLFGLNQTTDPATAILAGKFYFDELSWSAGKAIVAAAMKTYDLLPNTSSTVSIAELIGACPELPSLLTKSEPAVAGLLMQRPDMFRVYDEHTDHPKVGLHSDFGKALFEEHPYKLGLKLYKQALRQTIRDNEQRNASNLGVEFGPAGGHLLPNELQPIRQLYSTFKQFAVDALSDEFVIMPKQSRFCIVLPEQVDRYLGQLVQRPEITSALPKIADALVKKMQVEGQEPSVLRMKFKKAVKILSDKFHKLIAHLGTAGFLHALMTQTALSETFWVGTYSRDRGDGAEPEPTQYIELRPSAAKQRGLKTKRCAVAKKVFLSGGEVKFCRFRFNCHHSHVLRAGQQDPPQAE